MIVFEARNSYEFLVSVLLARGRIRDDSRCKVTIFALNFSSTMALEAVGDIGIRVIRVRSTAFGATFSILFEYFRRHMFRAGVKELFVFHEISPLIINAIIGVKVILVEHGEINYNNVVEAYSKFAPWHPYKLMKCMLKQSYVGEGKIFLSVYLKDPREAPQPIKAKVQPLDLAGCFDALGSMDKDVLYKVFSYRFGQISSNTHPRILVTQPFSEIGLVDEERKIEIYRAILCRVHGITHIKPHPKEVTEYARIFPNIVILDKDTPFELLWLSELRRGKVYTISSSVGRMGGIEVTLLGDEYFYG